MYSSIFILQDKRNTLYFNDGIRRIDLILVYEEEDVEKGVINEQEAMKIENRRIFQENLLKEGLELEIEDKKVNLNYPRSTNGQL